MTASTNRPQSTMKKYRIFSQGQPSKNNGGKKGQELASRIESREQGVGTKSSLVEDLRSKEDRCPDSRNTIANVFVCGLAALLSGREVSK